MEATGDRELLIDPTLRRVSAHRGLVTLLVSFRYAVGQDSSLFCFITKQLRGVEDTVYNRPVHTSVSPTLLV